MKINISSIFFIISVFTNILGYGQHEIKGRVLNDKNEPIPDVNIIVRGTVIGTISNTTGDFHINIPADSSILRFSIIGYNSQLITVTAGEFIEIILKENRYDYTKWPMQRGERPLAKKKNKNGITTIFATENVILENNILNGRLVSWPLGAYTVFLPYDSIRDFLIDFYVRPFDLKSVLDFIPANIGNDTILLSNEFVEMVGEGLLSDLAIRLLKSNSIAIADKNNVFLKSLIVREVTWVGNKRCGNCCWNGIEFIVNEKDPPLFTITRIIC